MIIISKGSWQFESPGENTEKCIIFSNLIKNENQNGKTVTEKIKFIDNIRFMATLSSCLNDNLPEGLRIGKCKYCKSCFECLTVNDGLLVFS